VILNENEVILIGSTIVVFLIKGQLKNYGSMLNTLGN